MSRKVDGRVAEDRQQRSRKFADHAFTFVLAMAPVTAILIFSDTMLGDGPLFKRITLGISVGIMAGLIWPITWAFWLLRHLAVGDSVPARLLASIGLI